MRALLIIVALACIIESFSCVTPRVIGNGNGLSYIFLPDSTIVGIYDDCGLFKTNIILPFYPASVAINPNDPSQAIVVGVPAPPPLLRRGLGKHRQLPLPLPLPITPIPATGTELAVLNLCDGTLVARQPIVGPARIELIEANVVFVSSPRAAQTCVRRFGLPNLVPIPGLVCFVGGARIVGTILEGVRAAILSTGLTGQTFDRINLDTFTLMPSYTPTAGVPIYANNDIIISYDGVETITFFRVNGDVAVPERSLRLGFTSGATVLDIDYCCPFHIHIMGFVGVNYGIGLVRVDLHTLDVINVPPIFLTNDILAIPAGAGAVGLTLLPVAATVQGNNWVIYNNRGGVYVLKLSNGVLFVLGDIRLEHVCELKGRDSCHKDLCCHHHKLYRGTPLLSVYEESMAMSTITPESVVLRNIE
ncbi:YSH1 [Acrasis kona]|uniref:YSH1 n=1 Tax=Acrasis kona TaxID=1008807 RepID=A0AAW2YK45_9EUKA